MKHPIHSFAPAIVSAGLLLLARPTHAADYYFSHYSGEAGAVGRFSVEGNPPKLGSLRDIGEDKEAFRLTRLRMGPGGRLFGMNESNDAPWVLAFDPATKSANPKRIVLGDRPTELRVAGKFLLTTGHRGMLHLIDPATDTVAATWTPPAGVGRVTDFAALPDGSAVIGIARQDSTTGNVKGHRVMVFDLPSLKLRHDLQLPRNQAGLHFKPDGKDSGPGPLFVLLSPATNTILIGLNAYGAVQLADLDGVLKGEWRNSTVLPTSADGAWGTSFPSVGTTFTAGGRDYALIGNGSVEGGSVLVDLAARKITQQLATGPRSLNLPVHQPGSKRIVALSTGVEYTRGDIGINDKHVEPSHFFVIDLAPLETGGQAAVKRITLPEFIYEGTPVDPANDDLWVIAVRNPQTAALSLVLFDVAQEKELGRRTSPGVVRNFVPAS